MGWQNLAEFCRILQEWIQFKNLFVSSTPLGCGGFNRCAHSADPYLMLIGLDYCRLGGWGPTTILIRYYYYALLFVIFDRIQFGFFLIGFIGLFIFSGCLTVIINYICTFTFFSKHKFFSYQYINIIWVQIIR